MTKKLLLDSLSCSELAIASFNTDTQKIKSSNSHFKKLVNIEHLDEIISKTIQIEVRLAIEKEFYWEDYVEIKLKKNQIIYCKTVAFVLRENELSIVIVVNQYKQCSAAHRITYCELTGLLNRDKFLEDLKITGSSYLCIININDFTYINSFFTGDIADQLLVNMGALIKEKFQEASVYRTRTDEFAVLFDTAPKDSLKKINTKIKKFCSKYFDKEFKINEQDIMIDVTLGLAYGERGTLLIKASIALKEARRLNKKNVLFSQSLQESLDKQGDNIFYAKLLKNAIIYKGIAPYYQPIICNATGKVYKHEALCRMITHERVYTPYYFMEVSKKIKQYSKITRLILSKVLKDIKSGNIDYVSVNISMEDIANNTTRNFIYDSIKNSIGKNITFEILETEEVQNYKLLENFINKVKSFGAKVAIDDFGTGYCSFEHLSSLEIDYVKIDGRFIKNLDKSQKDRDIVEAIVVYCKKHNIKTIAEFVENETILFEVKKLGVDYSQGYYFGKPISSETLFEKDNE